METLDCLICDTDNTEVLFSKRDGFASLSSEYTIVQCRKCGLVYVNPRPTAKEIANFYPEYYSWKEEAGQGSFFSRLAKTLEGMYRFHLLNYEVSRLLKLSGITSGAILDIGCGTGDRLSIFKKKGFNVYGIEPSGAANYGREKFDLHILQGRLPNPQLPANHFDIITLYNVFEHLHNPRESLSEMRRLLNDKGFLVIQVPNIDSPQFSLFKRNWAAFDVPRDLYYFNLTTISTLLASEGFEMVTVDYANNWFHPPTIVLSLLPRLDPRMIWRDEKKHTLFFKRALWFFFTLLLSPFCIGERLMKKSAIFTIHFKKRNK